MALSALLQTLSDFCFIFQCLLLVVCDYCHKTFGFTTYVFLLVSRDHNEMQALSFIFTFDHNVSAICPMCRYTVCMLCGVFILQAFSF